VENCGFDQFLTTIVVVVKETVDVTELWTAPVNDPWFYWPVVLSVSWCVYVYLTSLCLVELRR